MEVLLNLIMKLLNEKGEFITGENGAEVLALAESEDFDYAEVDELGKYETRDDAFDIHIQQILNLPMVDAEAIKAKKFKRDRRTILDFIIKIFVNVY